MMRIMTLAAVTMMMAAPCPAEPMPEARGKNPAPANPTVGLWSAVFENGVKETCEIRPDGTATESEPLRASKGKVERKDGAVVITFADDRVERWTAVGNRMVVEHWFPAAQYPAGPRVLGIADRKELARHLADD
ncbi:hypothetical protein [Zavarzinella formosa]|uniref:hypothetical protein n=1 Tax=Zavarzinella formosa TaxID=360055 RepID=UPI0005943410|nr:hypothetical protein [Zavarzinella formosa]